MGCFDKETFYQIQTVHWLAMQTLPEELPTATEALIWAEPKQSWVLLSPGKPARRTSGDKAALGKTQRPLGFQMGHSRCIRQVKTTHDLT